jgi:Xaa-Pro dipeptidase
MISKRAFMAGAAALGVSTFALAQTAPVKLSLNAKPITAAERQIRVAKVQGLMQAQGIAALLIESGSTLDYFTGVQWWTSERVTAAVLPAKGVAIIVTPAFEEPSIRETLQIEADVRPWNEHENPEALILQTLKDRGYTSGRIAIEPDVRFFIVDALKAQSPAYELISGQKLVNACRQIKSAAELALMQTANDITIAALKQVHAAIKPGMTGRDISALMDAATIALGGSPEFSMALLNEASAYPHGSKQPQSVREGSVILMDCGCSVHGYESDISRSWVYGTPSTKQRKVWETVKHGQEIVMATARPGLPAGRIDDAVRAFYEKEGWGPGYRLPGLPHRTGHGIGMDGHESPYLVHNEATPLSAGMCFSNEPGLYIPGEFGIRLEDCWYMTGTGPKLFTPLARSIDDPI